MSVGVATATAGGGNSAAAKACQKGGWKNWVRADHTAFKNEGDCVSYAAKGGVLTSPKSVDQLLCESLGGGYAGPDAFGDLWSCSNVPYADGNEFNAKFDALFNQCYIVEGNTYNFSTTGVTLNFECRPR